MRLYEERAGRDVLLKTECDICGASTEFHRANHPLWDYMEMQTYVSVRMSVMGPIEASVQESKRLDICPKCFKEKIVPLKRNPQ